MMDTSFLVGNAPTPLLNPLDIQAKRIAIRNALAAGALQQQQIQGGALALQQQQLDMNSDAAFRARYSQPATAPAPAAAPPTPAAPSGPLPFSVDGGMVADPTAGNVPAPPPPAAAPAAAPPTAAHDVSDNDILGYFGQKGYALIHARNEAVKTANESSKLANEGAALQKNYWGSLAFGLQAVNYDPGAVQATLSQAKAHGYENTPQYQIFAANQNNPDALRQLSAQAIADSPEQQKLLNERTTASAAQTTANEKKQTSDREAANQARGQALSALAAAPNGAAYGAIWAKLPPELRSDASIPKPAQWTPQTAVVLQGAGMSSDQQVTTAQTASHNAALEANEKRARDQEQQRINLERQKTSFDQGAIQRAGEALGRGELTRIQDIASLRGDQRLQIYDIAKRVNPNFNVSEVDRMVKNEDYYANGKGADSLRSFNTFLEHAGSASDAVNNIRLSGVPVINKPLNWWREHLSGSADYQQLIGSLEPVRKEFEGYLLGGHALQAGDRQAAEVILNDNSSPAQIQQALKTMGHTAVARAREENFRYKKVSKHDLVDAFSPEAIEGAKKIGTELNFGSSGAAPAAPAPGGAPASGDGLQHKSTDELLQMLTNPKGK